MVGPSGKPGDRDTSSKRSHRRGSSLVPNAAKRTLFVLSSGYYLPGKPTNKYPGQNVIFRTKNIKWVTKGNPHTSKWIFSLQGSLWGGWTGLSETMTGQYSKHSDFLVPQQERGPGTLRWNWLRVKELRGKEIQFTLWEDLSQWELFFMSVLSLNWKSHQWLLS